VAFGAVLGKVSPMQLLIMTFFQVTLFTVNEFILLNLIEVSRARGVWGEGQRGRQGERSVVMDNLTSQ
jgi:hypothetical protein